jgi:hypothetical protein
MSKTTRAPFTIGQTLQPTNELLVRYPEWAKTHGGECTVASIEPSFNHKGSFQAWDIHITFANEAVRWLVSEHDIEDQ